MSMKNILPEKEGSQITVYETLYYQVKRHHNSGNTNTLFIVYRDSDKKKKVISIPNPNMEIYFLKESERGKFFTPREYIEMDKVYPVTVRANKVLGTIYDEMRNTTDPEGIALKRIYDQAVSTGTWGAMKEIFKWPYTFMSDMDVEDYYRVMLGYHYDTSPSHPHIINKCFLDIESDVLGLTNSQINDNMDPTNACTLIFSFDEHETGVARPPQVHTFLLRNHKRYKHQKYFEEHLDEFYKKCHEVFDHQSIIADKKEKILDTTAMYKITLYDNERDLLQAIFDTINSVKPDVCEVWNIAYDIPKLYNRMINNNLNPIDVMSDKLFPKGNRFVTMKIDNRAGVDIANRNTNIRMTSTTLYIDQMQAYAGIRKGRKAYGSNTLDNIAKIECGLGKWEFRKGINVFNAAIEDYWNFVLYNIRDVWCQYLIDYATNDSMSMIYDMNQMNCPLQNLTKQTKYQKQIYYTNYLRKGYVPGNNANVDYFQFNSEEQQESASEFRQRWRIMKELDKRGIEVDDDIDSEELNDLYDEVISYETDDNADEESEAVENNMTDAVDIYKDSVNRRILLPGGLVGNPDFNIANGTEVMDGVHSKHIFDHAVDMDYSSEYPWAKVTRSLSRSTQIGRLIIPEKISERQNQLPLGRVKREADNKLYLPGAEFTADYLSGDVLSFGNVWFGLPGVDEMTQLVGDMIDKDKGE